MDTELLVDSQIDDGQRLLEQLVRDGFEVRVAVWVKTSEVGLWHLYLASPAVDEQNPVEALRKVYASIDRIPDSSVTPVDITLVHDTNPIARDAVALRDRYPSKNPPWYRGRRLGRLPVGEAYVYPLKGLRQSFSVTYVRQQETNHWTATIRSGKLYRRLEAKGAVSYSTAQYGGETSDDQRLAIISVLVEVDPKFDAPEFLDDPDVRRLLTEPAREMADELFRQRHLEAVLDSDEEE